MPNPDDSQAPMSTPESQDQASTMKSRLLRPAVIVPVSVVVLALAIVALSLFQPWKLFVDQQVNEALPGDLSPAPSVSSESSVEGATSTPVAPATPTVLASGSFISHEHATTGGVQILQLPDGSRVLRIEDLNTSNGPDLKVWLTNAPVIEGVAGWGVFDDGQWVDLGALKGNQGSQNYVIPAEVDLTNLTSLSIWCDRFNVSFGAASLIPA